MVLVRVRSYSQLFGTRTRAAGLVDCQPSQALIHGGDEGGSRDGRLRRAPSLRTRVEALGYPSRLGATI